MKERFLLERLKSMMRKLDIIPPQSSADAMDNMMKEAINNFGQPDTMFVSGSVMKTLLDSLEKDDDME